MEDSMSGLMAEGHASSKRVMCIALVGVRPTDKILLKQYLRTLVGLKVDIDWVLVSYPNVDLFLIGSDFFDSTVVTKLLVNQKDKPVLYVSQKEDEEGRVEDNQIFLPLQNLDSFERWLLDSVAVLSGNVDAGANAKIAIETADKTTINFNEDAAATQAKSNQLKAASDSNPLKNKKKQAKGAAKVVTDKGKSKQTNDANTTINKNTQTHQNGSQHSTNATALNTSKTKSMLDTLPISSSIHPIEGYAGIISLVEQIQQGVNGFYQITANTKILAIIEPSRGRVWPIKTDDGFLALSLDWQLQSYTGEPPKEDNAGDLIQYLWQYGWIYADLLLPLINDELSYQLSYWIKPGLTIIGSADSNQLLAKTARQQLLAIMNALELSAYNIKQLSDLTAIPLQTTEKIVASLLFVGSVKAIEASVSTSPVDAFYASKQLAIESGNKGSSKNSKIDYALVDNQVATDDFFIEETKALEQSKQQAAQQEKRGFLSRLRSKLGL